MIFVGLVVMWLLILVPAVARRRQEVARPSVTALSGRVLERTPRRDPDADREPAAGRDVEVNVRHEQEPVHAVATKSVPGVRTSGSGGESIPHGRDLDKLDGWTWHDLDDPDADDLEAEPDRGRAPEREPGPRRYRPGRGGYDPQAAAAAARARCAFRQRVVVTLLVLAVGTAVAAVFTLPQLWFAHAVVDVVLVGYLAYLRRQVRVEEAIRRRRTARIAAPRRALDIENDGPPPVARSSRPKVDSSSRRSTAVQLDDVDDEDAEGEVEDGDVEPEQPRSSQADTPVDRPASRATPPAAAPKLAEPVDSAPALPRLQPIPTPPVPIGTTLVEGEDDDPALHELDSVTRPDYRRASGQ
jgi:hypothetical protein